MPPPPISAVVSRCNRRSNAEATARTVDASARPRPPTFGFTVSTSGGDSPVAAAAGLRIVVLPTPCTPDTSAQRTKVAFSGGILDVLVDTCGSDAYPAPEMAASTNYADSGEQPEYGAARWRSMWRPRARRRARARGVRVQGSRPRRPPPPSPAATTTAPP